MPSEALRKYMAAGRDDGTEWDAGEVVPGLWVGGLSAAEDSEQLALHKIASVVTVAARLKPQIPEGTPHIRVVLDDHPCADLLKALPAALEAIDAVLLGGGPEGRADGAGVLVHCASGVSRSVATCVAWLMLRRKFSMEDALRQVREGRPNGNPNAGFQRALRLLEASGGDLEEASKKWAESNPMEVEVQLRALRAGANMLHGRADELEERAARHRSAAVVASSGGGEGVPADGAGDASGLIAELEKLQQDIDVAAPQSELDDRPARSIRKAAAQKVERLLQQLQTAGGGGE